MGGERDAFRGMGILAFGFLFMVVAASLSGVYLVRSFTPPPVSIDLRVYEESSNADRKAEKGGVLLRAIYECGEAPCTEKDRVFFELTGGGVEGPHRANLGSHSIKEAVIKDMDGGGKLVYYNHVPQQPGYTTIKFRCDPGSEVRAKAILESGGYTESAEAIRVCPSP